MSRKNINEKLTGDQAEKQANTNDVNVRQEIRFYYTLNGNYIKFKVIGLEEGHNQKISWQKSFI